jgi:hypothetical protein
MPARDVKTEPRFRQLFVADIAQDAVLDWPTAEDRTKITLPFWSHELQFV